MINDLQDVESQPWDLPPVTRSEQPRRRLPRVTWIMAAAAAVVVIAALAEALDNQSDDTTPTSDPSENGSLTDTDSDNPSPSQTPSSSASTPAPPLPSYRVLRVVSGDTVRVAYQGGATVRVIGIATPTVVKRGTFAQCSNKAASKYASKLLGGAEVMLRAIHPTDGRVLAQIELGDGDRDFGLAMIRHGYAIHDPTTDLGRLRTAYRAAEADAKAAHRGLWGHCRSLMPDLAAEDSSALEDSQGPRDNPQELRDHSQNQDNGGAGASHGCDPRYLDACMTSYPPDVNCEDVDGSATMAGRPDPHGLNGNAVACE